MLDPARYLLGVLVLLLLAAPAWLAATHLRRRLLPEFTGAASHLASGVLTLAILVLTAQLLGTASLFQPVPYVIAVIAVSLALRTLVPSAPPAGGAVGGPTAVLALAVAAIALAHFAWEGRDQIGSGMTGFDTTWYHGPFAAGFFQTGDTLDLHFIAPQFLAWFYPANSELVHAIGMLAFGRDILSPLLNLGWFAGCLLAAWCIGRPYRVAPWSLVLAAVALSVPALADQAGEARNDIVGIFFLLAAVAVLVNAWPRVPARGESAAGGGADGGGLSAGALVVAGLSVGLAAGTKLNFLLPAAVLVLGLAFVAPRGRRWRAVWISSLAALAGGGYWYLRNLLHTGNPLPWIDSLGPIPLPAPDQALGGREAHSVLGYLFDGAVWSDWFLPGLRDGLWFIWPLVVLAALAGLVLCLIPRRSPSPGAGTRGLGRRDPVLALAGLVGLATALAWLLAPTSASGPEGMPRGFESGLRYLAPALVLGLALLPTASLLRSNLAALPGRSPAADPGKALGAPTPGWQRFGTDTDRKLSHAGRRAGWGVAVLGLLVAIGVGYAYQRHYLEERYERVSFSVAGLNRAFEWGSDVRDARIATTSTRQYPLFGDDLSNQVEFVGEPRPHGGFEAPTTCRRWRQLLNQGNYDYVITTWDRTETGKPPFPPQTRWTKDPSSRVILNTPPTVVFQLLGPLNPSRCSQ